MTENAEESPIWGTENLPANALCIILREKKMQSENYANNKYEIGLFLILKMEVYNKEGAYRDNMMNRNGKIILWPKNKIKEEVTFK